MLLRLLILAILGVIIYRAVRSLTGAGQNRQRMSGRKAEPIADDMIQDPQCGVYFPRREGVILSLQGKELLFCSEDCRKAYQELHQNGN